MKFALLMVAALMLTGVTLVATADEAAACVPHKCPTVGDCHIEERETGAHVDTVFGPVWLNAYSVECYW